MKVNRPDTVDPSSGCSTWASVVKGKKRLSLPLYDSQDDSTDLELCNFFTPLAALPQSPSLLLNVDCADGKRNVTPSVISKRRRSPCSKSSSIADSPSDKRPRLCTSSPEDGGKVRAPAATPRAPSAVLQPPPSFGPSAGAAPPHPQSSTNADANSASLVSAPHHLPPKHATYNSCMVSNNPEILIVGDYIVRHLTLPGAITYCLSGGKVNDLIELIPTLIDLHPTVNFVLMNVGANDIMARNSSKLHADLESLCYTTESLGRGCIMSGPIPNLSKNSERFS